MFQSSSDPEPDPAYDLSLELALNPSGVHPTLRLAPPLADAFRQIREEPPTFHQTTTSKAPRKCAAAGGGVRGESLAQAAAEAAVAPVTEICTNAGPDTWIGA